MKEFPVLAELIDCFQSWIRQNDLARFDCFLDPPVDCDCYKCETVLATINAIMTYFEDRLDSIKKRTIETMDVVPPLQPCVELPPMIDDMLVPMNAVPLYVSVA